MKPGFHTFAHEFQARGYRTHFIGKYGIDSANRSWSVEEQRYVPAVSSMPTHLGPLSRGFHTFYGLYNSGHNHFTKKVLGTVVDWHKFNETHFLEAPMSLDTEIVMSSTHLFTRETINVIQQDSAQNRPWFIHLSFTMYLSPSDTLYSYIPATSTVFQYIFEIFTFCGEFYKI